MKLLDHLNPADYNQLRVINDDWPFQFLSEYTRFHLHFYLESIKIAYDEELDAYMPLRFLEFKLFKPAQILYAPMKNAVELDAEGQRLFFNKLIKTLYYRGYSERLVQPHPYSILAVAPAGSKFCEFGTYIIDLENQTEDEIFSHFHPKYQKAINHSVKNGAEIKIGIEVLNDFYNVYESTMRRVHTHNDSFEYFKELHDYLGDDRVCCAVVYDNGEPVSGIFLIYTRHRAFLTHAGTQGDSKLYGAAKLLNFETMKILKSKGVRKYDFVGVRLKNNNPALEGIFRFKKGFGGELKTGYLWKIDILPMKAKAYDFLLRLKSDNTLVTDIIDQVSI